MIILVINCGSSSIKYQVFKMPEKNVLAKGLVEKIGEETSRLVHNLSGNKHTIEQKLNDHQAGMSLIIKTITDQKLGVISNMSEIGAVGHRVVHGGEEYSDSHIIDDSVIKTIKDCSDLAPLHNPPNLMGIQEARAALPDVKMVAVFDTAFHQTLPQKAFTYALPYELYENFKVRRYGFHGTSHAYVAEQAAQMLGKKPNEVNLITCHLGNGASVAAVKNGESVDTSMGLTPLEGLVMGTRCGDLDPAIIFYLQGKKEYSNYKDIDTLFNKKSGLLGVSGVSNDMRSLHEISGSNERAKLALDIFSYRLKKYIGSYMAVLGQVDAVVFTGGIGEKDEIVRREALSGLDNMGLSLDVPKNDKNRGEQTDISTPSSKIKVLVIPTDEEGRIASDTYRLCK